MKAILTVIGRDKPGIIARVSGLLAEKDINIEDISQTVIQGNFTMIMLIRVEEGAVRLTDLIDECRALGDRIGVEIHLQHEDIFNAMHKI